MRLLYSEKKDLLHIVTQTVIYASLICFRGRIYIVLLL